MSTAISTKRSRLAQASRKRSMRFPTDRPYGRLLLRDRKEVARNLPEWRRMWRRWRFDLERRLRYIGLPPDIRADMLREDQRWFWNEYEAATWQRERAAGGAVTIRNSEDVWLQVTDEKRDLAPLTALHPASLWGLSLEYPVADDAIGYVTGLTGLRRLYLEYDNTVTDSGLGRLSALSMLTELSIDGPRLTDSGMAHLRRLPNLRSLDLHCPRVSMAAVARAVRHLELEELSIRLCEPLSDADVPSVCALPASLLYFSANRKGLSLGGVARIEEALPRCHLDLFWLDPPMPSERQREDDPLLIDPWSIELPRARIRTKPGKARDRWRNAQRNALIGPLVPVSVDNR